MTDESSAELPIAPPLGSWHADAEEEKVVEEEEVREELQEEPAAGEAAPEWLGAGLAWLPSVRVLRAFGSERCGG